MYSTLRAIKTQFDKELMDTYDQREIEQLFYRSVQFVTGLSRTDFILNKGAEISEEDRNELREMLNRLVQNEPIQYILQQAYFLDDTFYVNPHVLIPRPETEELVQWIYESHTEALQRLLDIGTGSGIIPVTLAKRNPGWEVSACDISNEALVVARRNAREILTRGEVRFYYEDILNSQTDYDPPLDIIVSNPPYVLESDKLKMAKNVLDHEPHLALFVDDHDPLLFYHKIAEFGQQNLARNGYLYFEIHEDLANDVTNLMQSEGYRDIQLRNDLQQKPRMVRAQK